MAASSVQIVDKDGGRAVELKGDRDGSLPIHVPPSGDRVYWTKPIDIVTLGDNVVHTPASGKKFHITAISFTLAHSGEVQFKSGASGGIGGPMNFAVNGGLAIASPAPKGDNERPLMRGILNDDTLIINLAARADLGGFVSGYDE